MATRNRKSKDEHVGRGKRLIGQDYACGKGRRQESLLLRGDSVRIGRLWSIHYRVTPGLCFDLGFIVSIHFSSLASSSQDY